MNTKAQLACAWSGIVFLGVVVAGWWLVAQFIPPHLPTAGADEIAAIYQANTVRIRAGTALALSGVGLLIPFAAVIAVQMKRIEGANAVLAYTQLTCSAVGVVVFLVPMMIWTAIAFRPERSPEIMLAMNDVAWLLFLMTMSPFCVQNIAIGVAIFLDKRAQPIFPKWAGYLNIWVAILFIPVGVITFFKTGPFAWNGILAFWLPLSVAGIWFVVMFFLLLKAIGREAAEAGRN